jgi:3'(2'), 5'-bisphosphate nucleotidase
VPVLDPATYASLMDELTRIVAHAAETILDLAGNANARTKADGSPVTAADEAAEAVIREGLQRIAPGVVIISEEHAAHEKPNMPSGKGASYFLVDPLDGTREFIAGRDEYTVNVALMTDGVPVLGIISAPAIGDIWRGIAGNGADRISGAAMKQPTKIHTRPRPAREAVVMVSRSHLEARTRDYVERFTQAKQMQSGSSVKFCRVAEGSADLYPRLAPTHDWDIAAGHAIVTAAGGNVAAPDGSLLRYGTPDLLIPEFVAMGDTMA